jgi:integrase
MVECLKPPSEGNRIEYDREIPGFGVRITASGVISFVLNYHIHGRERRITIGRWPEWTANAARTEAIDLRQAIREGRDPLHDRELSRTERTFKSLADDYLERYATKNKRESSLRNDKQMLQAIIVPKVGQLPLSSIGRRDIEALHHSLKATPYRANRVLSLLSKMFSLATEWKWLTENPAIGIPRYHEDKRETWLNTEQLEKLHSALDSYPFQATADAIRLLILTGAREGEVLAATWDQFDLVRAIWTKPSHHTKQKKIEHVPLSVAALRVLKQMPTRKTGSYLFPGRGTGKARVSIRRAWVQVCKASGLITEVKLPGKRKELIRYRPTVRIHDLRHTFASHLVSTGESLHIVGRLWDILNHKQRRATRTLQTNHSEQLPIVSGRLCRVSECHKSGIEIIKRTPYNSAQRGR